MKTFGAILLGVAAALVMVWIDASPAVRQAHGLIPIVVSVIVTVGLLWLLSDD